MSDRLKLDLMEEILCDAIFPTPEGERRLAEVGPMTPQQVMTASYFTDWADAPSPYLDLFSQNPSAVLHLLFSLNVIAAPSREAIALGYISSFLPDKSRSSLRLAKVYGLQAPLRREKSIRLMPKEEQKFEHALNSVRRLLNYEAEILGDGSKHVKAEMQNENSPWNMMRDEVWLEINDLFRIPRRKMEWETAPWGGFLHIYMNELSVHLKAKAFDAMITFLASWEINKATISKSLLGQGYSATLAHSSAPFQDDVPSRRLHTMACTFYEEWEGAPQCVVQEILPHLSSLTWEQLLSFSELVQEYNLEWAVSAMDWSQPCSPSESVIELPQL